MNPQSWPSRSVLANTPGTIGYVLIALLTATSFHFFARRIGAVYALSFLKRIPTISVLYVIPFSILCVAIIVRVVGKRAQPTSASRHRLASGLTAARVRR